MPRGLCVQSYNSKSCCALHPPYSFYVRRVHPFHSVSFPARLQLVMGEYRKRSPRPQGILNGGRDITSFHHRKKCFSLYSKMLFTTGKNIFHHRHKPPSSQTQVFVATDTSLCQTEHLCLSRLTQDGTKRNR